MYVICFLARVSAFSHQHISFILPCKSAFKEHIKAVSKVIDCVWKEILKSIYFFIYYYYNNYQIYVAFFPNLLYWYLLCKHSKMTAINCEKQ